MSHKPQKAASGDSSLSRWQVHPGDKTGAVRLRTLGSSQLQTRPHSRLPHGASLLCSGSRSHLSKELWEPPGPHGFALETALEHVTGREAFPAPDSSRRLLLALVLGACDRFLQEGPWGGGASVQAQAEPLALH